jgi:hypothetical protein
MLNRTGTVKVGEITVPVIMKIKRSKGMSGSTVPYDAQNTEYSLNRVVLDQPPRYFKNQEIKHCLCKTWGKVVKVNGVDFKVVSTSSAKNSFLAGKLDNSGKVIEKRWLNLSNEDAARLEISNCLIELINTYWETSKITWAEIEGGRK